MWKHFNKGTLRGVEIIDEEEEKKNDALKAIEKEKIANEKAGAKFETDYDEA